VQFGKEHLRQVCYLFADGHLPAVQADEAVPREDRLPEGAGAAVLLAIFKLSEENCIIMRIYPVAGAAVTITKGS